MTDTKALKEIISNNGLKLKYVAEQLGLSQYGFSLKVENKKEFKTSEVTALCELLNINSLEDKEKIFFKRWFKINNIRKEWKISNLGKEEEKVKGIQSIEVVEVIKTKTVVGDGTKENPVKEIIQYWDKNGKLISQE